MGKFWLSFAKTAKTRYSGLRLHTSSRFLAGFTSKMPFPTTWRADAWGRLVTGAAGCIAPPVGWFDGVGLWLDGPCGSRVFEIGLWASNSLRSRSVPCSGPTCGRAADCDCAPPRQSAHLGLGMAGRPWSRRLMRSPSEMYPPGMGLGLIRMGCPCGFPWV